MNPVAAIHANSSRPERQQAAEFRQWCAQCRRASVNCYCAMIEPVEARPRFVILIHPREARHRLGTGRMAHRMLPNSRLFEGVDFTDHEGVNREIANAGGAATLLFPGVDTINLSQLPGATRLDLDSSLSQPVIFVPDGTWKTARKMVRLSANLSGLPRLTFDPPVPSSYGFRREPRPECLSTIEAIHQVIRLLRCDNSRHPMGPTGGLLAPFEAMVRAQLARSPS